MKIKLFATILLTLSLSLNMYALADKYTLFRELFNNELSNAEIVGGSFVFVKNGEVLGESNHGMANIATAQKADRDTIYHWASNTKPFTGIAIMQLRDRGLIKLDDPVTKYVPELHKIHNSFGSMDTITIRHLLTHSGGFRNGTWPWRNNKPWEPFEPTEWSQLVAMFPFTEVMFEPGSKFSYSNPGIIYLGRVIEEVSGEPYETYIDKNIFRPLGMHNTYFDTTPPHLLKHRSHSYYIENEKRTEGRFDADTGITVSNSGLNSPVTDMVKYLNFLTGTDRVSVSEPPASAGGQNAGTQETIYDLILKRSSLEEMWQPQLPTSVDANGNTGFSTHIGLTYFIDSSNNRKLIGHGGDQNGFLSYIDVEPATKSAVLIVMNSNVIYPPNTPPEKDVVSRLRTSMRKLF